MIIYEDKDPYADEDQTKWYHPIVLLFTAIGMFFVMVWIMLTFFVDKIKDMFKKK